MLGSMGVRPEDAQEGRSCAAYTGRIKFINFCRYGIEGFRIIFFDEPPRTGMGGCQTAGARWNRVMLR
jgi:hypothetical protein